MAAGEGQDDAAGDRRHDQRDTELAQDAHCGSPGPARGQLRARNRRRVRNRAPDAVPRPTRARPTAVSPSSVAVAVVPSPVAGATPGTACTLSAALAVTPLEQSMSGW